MKLTERNRVPKVLTLPVSLILLTRNAKYSVLHIHLLVRKDGKPLIT